MKTFIDLAVTGGTEGREDTQGCWQETIANYLNNCTLLDVGAGLGQSKQRMGIRGVSVTTQDPGPKTPVDIHDDISKIKSKSYDVVTAFDVIEHIQEHLAFLAQMRRIAKKWIILTTPNIAHTKGTHIYHCKEYTPSEFLNLLGANSFGKGWMMLPEKGIVVVDREDFEQDTFCYNMCLMMEVKEVNPTWDNAPFEDDDPNLSAKLCLIA